MKLKRHLKRLVSTTAAAVLAISSLMPTSGGMLEIPNQIHIQIIRFQFPAGFFK